MPTKFIPDRSEETRITHFMSISPGIPFDLMEMTGFLSKIVPQDMPIGNQEVVISKAFGGRLQFGRLRNPADNLAYRKVMRQLEQIKTWTEKKKKLMESSLKKSIDPTLSNRERQHYLSQYKQLDGMFLDYLGGIFSEANRLWAMMLEEAGLFALESIAKKATFEVRLTDAQEANND